MVCSPEPPALSCTEADCMLPDESSPAYFEWVWLLLSDYAATGMRLLA